MFRVETVKGRAEELNVLSSDWAQHGGRQSLVELGYECIQAKMSNASSSNE